MRANRLLVCLYLAAAALPTAARYLRWHDHALVGALPRAQRGPLTLETVRSEAFQPQYTAWFEQRLGLRNWSIWIDNTVLYHLFRETKWGSHVVVGRDDTLYERDDIHFYNAPPARLPDPADVDRMAAHLAALQQRLQRAHRALIPMFVPSKTTVYPDKLPARWTVPMAEPRPSTERVYLTMKRALDAHHVVYVDVIDLVLGSHEPRDLLWGRDARHFSGYTACLSMREVMRHYAELTRTPPIDYPCQIHVEPAQTDHGDLDLYRLLNAWGVPRDSIMRTVEHEPLPATPPSQAPRVLWIATSFGFHMLDDAERSRRFPQLHVDYYHRTVYEAGSNVKFDANQHDARWQAIYPTRELYIVELFESYLSPPRFFGDALEALEAALGPDPPPAASGTN